MSTSQIARSSHPRFIIRMVESQSSQSETDLFSVTQKLKPAYTERENMADAPIWHKTVAFISELQFFAPFNSHWLSSLERSIFPEPSRYSLARFPSRRFQTQLYVITILRHFNLLLPLYMGSVKQQTSCDFSPQTHRCQLPARKGRCQRLCLSGFSGETWTDLSLKVDCN